MARTSTLGGGGGGPGLKNPNDMTRILGLASRFAMTNVATTVVAANAAGFFTEAALRGIADDTNWTADTYKTILSVSGGAEVYNIIGPTGLAGTPTTTFEITVDGVLYEIAMTATTTGHRAMLGAMMVTASDNLYGPDGVTSDKSALILTTYQGDISPWQRADFYGMPRLSCKTSLLIRMKSSENNSTTTNVERRSAVIYRAK